MTFDKDEADRQLREAFPELAARKLTFADKCAAFHALKQGVPPRIIGMVFGVSTTTAGHLKSATKVSTARKQKRYPELALEYQRLGELGFRDTYYSDDIHTRILKAKLDANQEGQDRRLTAPSAKADKYSYDTYGLIVCGHNGAEYFRIDFVRGGWFFCMANPDTGERIMPISDNPYRGQECNNHTLTQRVPFRTSSAARQAILIFVGDVQKYA